jgi:hypothetical protein
MLRNFDRLADINQQFYAQFLPSLSQIDDRWILFTDSKDARNSGFFDGNVVQSRVEFLPETRIVAFLLSAFLPQHGIALFHAPLQTFCPAISTCRERGTGRFHTRSKRPATPLGNA